MAAAIAKGHASEMTGPSLPDARRAPERDRLARRGHSNAYDGDVPTVSFGSAPTSLLAPPASA
jgi:hypothetical protein